jgi:DMSO/TMAO reductase YedYZ molybdopterin-dependent catalytic subunit
MSKNAENWSGTTVRPSGLIIRQKDPNNLEMPFDQLGDFITPALFYVRSHFPTPEIDLIAYRLSIGGAVRSELTLSYADIRAMPSRTCIATLECAGNSRVFLVPPAPGAQWELGAVGNAEWTGVPLSMLLERAGLADEVCELVFEGADRGVPREEPKPRGASWVQGDFIDPITHDAGRRWKYDWITPAQPGRYTLLSRATDADQRTQPDRHDPNFGSYVINHPLPIEVLVARL